MELALQLPGRVYINYKDAEEVKIFPQWLTLRLLQILH